MFQNITCSICIMLLAFKTDHLVLDNQSVCSSLGKNISLFSIFLNRFQNYDKFNKRETVSDSGNQPKYSILVKLWIMEQDL